MRHLARVHVPQLDLFRPAAGLVATPGGNAREGSAPDDAPATRAKERTGSTAGAGARVLITSRFSDWSELAGEVALDVLPLEEAYACFGVARDVGMLGRRRLRTLLVAYHSLSTMRRPIASRF